MNSASLTDTPPGHGFGARASLEAMADTVGSETRLLDELGALLRRQRAAVAADDLVAIEDSVYNTHRILMTLGEARRRRTALLDLIGVAVGEGPLRAEFDGLRDAALALSREVEISRRILRQAMEGNEELIRATYGTADGGSFYDHSAAPASPAAGLEGTFLHRRA